MSDSETIKQMVENYHSQLEVIGGYSEYSLYRYLRLCNLNSEDIIFALEYNEDREKSGLEIIQNDLIKVFVHDSRGW